MGNNGTTTLMLRNIRRTLILGAVISCLLLSLLVGAYTFRQGSAEAERDLAYVTSVKEKAISTHISSIISTAQSISTRNSIIIALASYEGGMIDLDAARTQINADMQSEYEGSKKIYGILTSARDGTILSSVGTVPPAIRPPSHEVQNQAYREPLMLSDGAYIVLDMPISLPDGNVVGYNTFIIGTKFLETILGSTEGDTVETTPLVGMRTPNGPLKLYPFIENDVQIDSETSIGAVISDPNGMAAPQLRPGKIDDGSAVIAAMDIGTTPLRLTLIADSDSIFAPARTSAYENIFIIVFTLVIIMIILTAILWPLSNRMLIRSDELERLVEEKTAKLQTELEARKEAEFRLEQQRNELSAFAHTVAHHLKNNIMVIENLLAMEGPSDTLDRARSTTAKMMEFITRQLKLADAGKAVTDIEECDLNTLIDTISHDYDIPIIHDKLPYIPCDKERMMEVLQNLATNAKNHGKATTMSINHQSEGPWHRITVTDNGAGIPEEMLPHVFEMGVSSSGSGFGLAIVKKIVEAHGGHIEALAAAEGARFVLALPC